MRDNLNVVATDGNRLAYRHRSYFNISSNCRKSLIALGSEAIESMADKDNSENKVEASTATMEKPLVI